MGIANRGKASGAAEQPDGKLSNADEALAQEALGVIVRLERRARLELVVEVGEYIVTRFFGGKIELARSFSPTKPEALARLIKLAPSREISASQLQSAIALAVQYRSLPGTVRDRLTVRQHQALLPVKDAQEKTKLARRAISEKLSGPALTLVVRSQQGPARRGPKPMGELERSVSAAKRALVSSLVENALEPAKVKALDPALRTRLLRDARTLRERIERITDALAGVK